MTNSYLMVLVTTNNVDEAKRISQVLLERKRAACTNIISKVDSSFWWEGKIDNEKEFLIIVKTTVASFNELVAIVKENHSYKVPEIIAVPIVGGSPEYLKWIDDSVKD